jgi:hypothetical protein
MNEKFSIVPPPDLIRQWMEKTEYDEDTWFYESYIAEQAAKWGADQELLATGNYLKQCAAWEDEDVVELYNYRRPRPKSSNLKEQAHCAQTQNWSEDKDLSVSCDAACILELRARVETLEVALHKLITQNSSSTEKSKVLDVSDLPQWTPEQAQKLKDLLGGYRNHLGLNEHFQ